VVDLAVEVEIGRAVHSVAGALVPDFHGIQEQGIKAQLDPEGAQGEVHLEDLFADGDGNTCGRQFLRFAKTWCGWLQTGHHICFHKSIDINFKSASRGTTNSTSQIVLHWKMLENPIQSVEDGFGWNVKVFAKVVSLCA
jgi:hypothetical protein